MFYDNHNPPHFHVEYGEFKAVNFEDEIIKGYMPKRALKLVFEWMELHGEELIQDWKLASKGLPLNKLRWKNIWITKAEHVKDYELILQFNDGSSGTIDLKGHLNKPIFEPLINLEYFKKFKLNSWTIFWDNGADFAPEFLQEQMKKHIVQH